MNYRFHAMEFLLLFKTAVFVLPDANECSLRTHFCDSNADCINTVGSYICQCRSGFSGDGQVCTGNFIDYYLYFLMLYDALSRHDANMS